MSSTDLAQLIQTELDLMQHFLFSLEKEHEMLLSQYSNDDLYDLTEIKNQYADQLIATAALRDSALQNLDLAIGRDGLIAAQSLYPDLHDLLEQLFQIAEQSRRLNEENGLLIHTYLDYSTEALQALAKAQPTTNEVYDAYGKKRAAANTRRGIVRV